MRAELPWNVAGIAPEAREAARAAARREGLSVGEWLTRRILRDLSDLADLGDDESAAKRRDTEDMLAQLAEAEAEATASYRRIEQKLRLVGTDFDIAGRSQSESNRAMSRAASEIHSAGREQAEAFEQVSRHMGSLEQRLDRLEQSGAQEGLKEAVKGLHHGLTRLAAELSQSTGRSGVQIASLARNLEQLALRLVAARSEAENTARLLDARLGVMEEAHKVTADAVDRAQDRWDEDAGLRTEILVQVEAQRAGLQEALGDIEQRVARVEEQARDTTLEQRLEETERSLAEVIASLEQDASPAWEPLWESLSSRLDALEKNHGAMLVELSTRMAEVAHVLANHEHRPSAGTSDLAGGPQAEEPSPELEEDAPPAPLEIAQEADPEFDRDDAFAADFHMPADLAEALARPAAPAIIPPGPAAEPQPVLTAAEPAPVEQEDFLKAARLSAMAAGRAETQGLRLLRRAEGQEDSGRYLALLAIAFLLLLGTALVLLMNRDPDRAQPPLAQYRAAPANPAAALTLPPPTRPVSAPAQDQSVVQPAPAAGNLSDKVFAAANDGNPAAETIMGLRYLDGEVNDPARARAWLEKAAAAGQPVAQYRLGTLYEQGQGVARNAALAVKWYLAAAGQGNRKAMHNLAVAYADGAAGPKNMAEAARWFAKAAALGLSDSEFNLAVLYERGAGVPQSLASAYKWYAVAAAQGDGESKARLKVLDGQLPGEARAAALRDAHDFHPLPLDPVANMPPQAADFGG